MADAHRWELTLGHTNSVTHVLIVHRPPPQVSSNRTLLTLVTTLGMGMLVSRLYRWEDEALACSVTSPGLYD